MRIWKKGRNKVMLKTLLGEVKQYKKVTLLTPVFTAAEVVMEVLLPYVTAMIIDHGINAGNMQAIVPVLRNPGRAPRGNGGNRFCGQSQG